jgi:hypothetical protein
MYALPNKTVLKVTLEGYDEPQEVAGYVFQVWDDSRPTFEVFRTEEDVAEYRAYWKGHPSYGGLWDWFVERLNDLWEGIKSGAAKIASVFVNAFNRVEVAFEVGNKHIILPALVVSTLEGAARAVGAAFQMVTDAVVRAVGWLMDLLDLSDIWDTRLALEQGLDTCLDLFDSSLDHIGTVASKWFAARKQDVDTLITLLEGMYADTRLGDFSNKVPTAQSPTGVGFSMQELNTPHANWFLDRMMAQVAGATPGVEFSPAKERAATSLTDLFTFLAESPEFTRMTTAFKDLGEGLLNPFLTDTSGSAGRTPYVRLLELIRELLESLLDALDAVVNKVLEFAKSGIETVKDLLKEPVPAGFFLVDALYQWVWKQARPQETPQPMTAGGLLYILAAFPTTVVYKLINGVENPPFPGGKFPAMPPPPWVAGSSNADPPTPPPCGGTPGTWDRNRTMIECQKAGVAVTILAPAISIWSDLIVPFWDEAPTGLVLYGGNFAGCVTGLLGTLLSLPPVGGDFDWTWASLGPFTVNCVRLLADFMLALSGPIIPALKRSALLKNTGFDLEEGGLKESTNIWLGAGIHLGLGFVSFGFNIANTDLSRPKTNRRRWDLGTAAMVCGFVPDLLQFLRAILYTYGKINPQTLIALVAITAVNFGCTLASVTCARIPPYEEWNNQPSIPADQEPLAATVGQKNYKWKIETSVGQHPINERPNWPDTPEELKTKFTFQSEDWGPFTAEQVNGQAEISCDEIPANAPSCVLFTVIGEDGYGPPLCAQASFVINIANAVDQGLVIKPKQLPDANVRLHYSASLHACGGKRPYQWAASALPAGLLLNDTTGTISGTPERPSTFTFTAYVADSSSPPRTAEQTVKLVVH